MVRFPSRSSNAALLLLCAALGACAPAADTIEDSVIAVGVRDVHVWNNVMPGSAPVCHAVLVATLRNASADSITLSTAEGLILDPRTGAPLRRFDAVMLRDDLERARIELAPRSEQTITIRSRGGLPPIDPVRHRLVSLHVRIASSAGRDVTVRALPVELMVAQ